MVSNTSLITPQKIAKDFKITKSGEFSPNLETLAALLLFLYDNDFLPSIFRWYLRWINFHHPVQRAKKVYRDFPDHFSFYLLRPGGRNISTFLFLSIFAGECKLCFLTRSRRRYVTFGSHATKSRVVLYIKTAHS